MTGAVALRGVTKRFKGGVTAVDDVSLEIAAGQFVTLLGPSGCGKTTLLRMIAGLERPTSGTIHLEGRDVTDLPPQRRGLGFTFQRYALFPHLTVLENVAFGLKVRGVPRRRRWARAGEMLELVRLAGLADRLPHEISGGQAQRVALARALAPEPTVLLLDEPLTALDLAVRMAMQEELRRIHQELGVTFIYVTHDQGEALTMSDRILLMKEGTVVQDATPFGLYQRPASLFAATFVGEANLWTGRVLADTPRGEACQVDADGLGGIEGVAGTELPGGAAAAYVVRPERVRLDVTAAAGTPVAVEDVVPRGAHTTILARTSAGVLVRVELDADEGSRFQRGQQATAAWAPRDGLVFLADADTGAEDRGRSPVPEASSSGAS